MTVPTSPLPESDPPRRDPQLQKDVWRGLALTVLLHGLQVPMAMLSGGLTIFFIGLTQLVYLIPAIFIAASRERPGIAKGLLIGGSVTFLLNAACFGVFFTMSMRW